MYEVVIRGFETLQQAKAFAEAYGGGGEQTMAIWSEECATPFPTLTVCGKNWLEVTNSQVIFTVK